MIGGGGHSKVLLDIFARLKLDVYAIVAPDIDHDYWLFKGLKHYKSDNDVLRYQQKEIALVNGVGSLPGDLRRQSIFDSFTKSGYEFLTVVSDLAVVSPSARLGSGVQIMAGAMIGADVCIGDNCIINTGAIIEHDCNLSKNIHVAPGATLSGGVVCGENVHIGTGANIIQGIQIGCGVVIGAGAAVSKNVQERSIVYAAKSFFSLRGINES